eukprot:965680_1
MAPALGTVVKLKDGQKGVVKYVGSTEFSDGQAVVGVELAEWTANTGDHTVNEDPIDSALSVNIGDRIVTVRGYTGVVRFKGGVYFDERETIGIELDQWS